MMWRTARGPSGSRANGGDARTSRRAITTASKTAAAAASGSSATACIPRWRRRAGISTASSRERRGAMTGFAELVAATNFSFLDGASDAGAMVGRAVELGLGGIGIADRNTVAGVVRAHQALK